MKHKSVPLLDAPIDFIDITQISPLISKCKIKVCYVSDKPNRNDSVITKEVAREIAQSLPGSPIVGYYNENIEDFEEHNKIIDISNGKITVKDTTRPYGFVDLNAKVWFQNFLDDDEIIREYLVTEGYLWTEQYPECQRVIDEGNNQSMELNEKTLDAHWAKGDNNKPQFFIINKAVIEKLCILGEDAEPCFEGSQISEFSYGNNFEQRMFSMLAELKELIKGGAEDMEETVLTATEEQPVVEPTTVEEPAIDFSENQKEEVCPECGKPLSECTCKKKEEYCETCNKPITECACGGGSVENKKKKKKDYSLDEIEEYQDLLTKYTELENNYNNIVVERDALVSEKEELISFKKASERKDKEAMINQFYMLSEEDKKDVIENIDNYSLDDIEAKLSIICVRNKVSFNQEETVKKDEDPMTYSLSEGDSDADDSVPAWVKRVMDVEASMNQ